MPPETRTGQDSTIHDKDRRTRSQYKLFRRHLQKMQNERKRVGETERKGLGRVREREHYKYYLIFDKPLGIWVPWAVCRPQTGCTGTWDGRSYQWELPVELRRGTPLPSGPHPWWSPGYGRRESGDWDGRRAGKQSHSGALHHGWSARWRMSSLVTALCRIRIWMFMSMSKEKSVLQYEMCIQSN